MNWQVLFEGLLGVVCLLLFLYIRYLHVTLAEISKKYKEEFEDHGKNITKSIDTLNDLIKKFKLFYGKMNKMSADINSIKRDMLLKAKDKMKNRSQLIIDTQKISRSIPLEKIPKSSSAGKTVPKNKEE